MPVVPDFLERLLVFRFNLGPGLILDAIGAAAFRAVDAALKLGIFEAIKDRPLTAKEAAHMIQADERATAILLEFLATTGFTRKRNGRYSNTPLTEKWLNKTTQFSFAPFIDLWQNFVFPFWDQHLEESIRRGKPNISIYEWFDRKPEAWRSAQAWFKTIAQFTADEIATKIKLPERAGHLLDLGGGHGYYSIAFLRRHPRLRATIFDLAKPLEIALETVKTENLTERVTLKDGDYTKDDIGKGYDITLLFNIIHANTADQNVELFRKVADALNPQGLIAILDLTGGAGGPTVKAFVQVFGLNFLTTLGGQNYALEEITNWLKTAGFTDPQQIRLRKSPGVSLLIAAKPS